MTKEALGYFKFRVEVGTWVDAQHVANTGSSFVFQCFCPSWAGTIFLLFLYSAQTSRHLEAIGSGSSLEVQ